MLDRLLHWFGYGLCHQLPERSYFGGGLQVPVCARDTGIYVGFVVAFGILLAVHGRSRPREFPRAHVWAVMGVMLAAMAWDGVTSYAGWRSTTNDLRLLTGLGVGFSVAALVLPMINDEMWRDGPPSRVMDPLWRFIAWLAGLPISFALVKYIAPSLGVAFPLLVVFAVLATLTGVNLVIVGIFPKFDRRRLSARQHMLAIALALALSVGEIAAADAIRFAVDSFFGTAF